MEVANHEQRRRKVSLSHIFNELLVSPSRKSLKEVQTGNSKSGAGQLLSSADEKDNTCYRNVHKKGTVHKHLLDMWGGGLKSTTSFSGET